MTRDVNTVALAGILLLLVGAGIITLAAHRLKILMPTLVALFIRFGYGFFYYLRWGIDGNDGISFSQAAEALATSWDGLGQQPTLPAGKEGWPYILATAYHLFGYSPELGIILNVLAGSLTVVVVSQFCREMQWESARLPSAWLTALWPVAFFWGPLLLREAIVTLLLSLALLGGAFLRTRSIASGVCVIAASGMSMIWMREGLSLLILIGIPVVVAVSYLIGRPNASSSLRFLLLGSLVVLLAVPVLGQRLEGSSYFDDARRQTVAQALDSGSTGFSQSGVLHGNAVSDILNTAIGPLPFAWKSPGLIAAGIDGLLWLSLWGFALYGWRHLRTNRWGAFLCLLPLSAIVIYLSGSSTNFGLIMRMRGMGLPFAAPIAGYGIAHLLAGRKKRPDNREAATAVSLASRIDRA